MSDIVLNWLAAGPPGSSGGSTTADQNVVMASISNSRAHDVEVTVGFSSSDGQSHSEYQTVSSFGEAQVTWYIGALAAGSYTFRVDVGADFARRLSFPHQLR